MADVLLHRQTISGSQMWNETEYYFVSVDDGTKTVSFQRLYIYIWNKTPIQLPEKAGLGCQSVLIGACMVVEFSSIGIMISKQDIAVWTTSLQIRPFVHHDEQAIRIHFAVPLILFTIPVHETWTSKLRGRTDITIRPLTVPFWLLSNDAKLSQ